MDDDPEELMYYLAEAFRTHRPGFNNRWEDKVLLGFWTVTFPAINDVAPTAANFR